MQFKEVGDLTAFDDPKSGLTHFVDPNTGERPLSRDTHTSVSRMTTEALRAAAIDRWVALLAVAGEVFFLAEGASDDRHSSSVPAGTVHAELTATIFGLVSALGMTFASSFMLWNKGVLVVPRYLMTVLLVINMLESLNGLGRPDVGGEFTDTSAVLSGDISALLHNAAPVEWRGVAAQHYSSHNDGLQSTVRTIADGDAKIVETLKAQAAQVEIGREMFAAIECTVSVAVGYALWWARTIQVERNTGATVLACGEIAQLKKLERFGLIVALVAALGLLATTGFLITEGLLHVHNFKQATRMYRQVHPNDTLGAAGSGAVASSTAYVDQGEPAAATVSASPAVHDASRLAGAPALTLLSGVVGQPGSGLRSSSAPRPAPASTAAVAEHDEADPLLADTPPPEGVPLDIADAGRAEPEQTWAQQLGAD
ncbi:MAG: hypothetical protein K2Q25_00135 [Mycobacteriaceae bacterium]|nr:hypothetical protein [Mycobacteriaceae bacterium]